MPLVQTRGAASAQGFGEFAQASGPANYIEDVFSTYLYTGTGAAQTITNNIDLSTKGGLLWLKDRNDTRNNWLYDTNRGYQYGLRSDLDFAETTTSGALTAFNNNGFSIGTSSNINASGNTLVSWSFRQQPKFFDVVTYTGNGANRTISHNLGSEPGCMIVKSTSAAYPWSVYHRAMSATPGTSYMRLNATNGDMGPNVELWNSTNPTSTQFSIGINSDVNQSGQTYVAYLFAHDAGGFGLTGTDNVISCGSYTGNGSATGPFINLGYETQWVMIKKSSDPESWYIYDNMRGVATLGGGQSDIKLRANSINPEGSLAGNAIAFNATGFNLETSDNELNNSGSTYIYIAIRRGPMKVPTSGTSVFAPLTYTGDGTSGRYISGAGFPPDLLIQTARSASENREFDDRLRGGGSTAMNALFSNSTSAEAANSGSVQLLNQDGFTVRSFGNGSSVTYIGECFRRAPSFFDEVCYTGTGTAGQTYTHNLGVVPELMIVKGRSIAEEWNVYFGNNTNYLKLNRDDVPQTATTRWNDTSPTSSVFSVGTSNWVNQSGSTYVAYLFASLAGVSKVGSYTGNGTTQTINCGFTGGARFVLIKRTDALGGWYVWDSARGIVAGNDPYLLLNTTAAEVTSTDYVDTYSAGFEISSTAPAAINASAGSFIFLAIA